MDLMGVSSFVGGLKQLDPASQTNNRLQQQQQHNERLNDRQTNNFYSAI